MSCEENIQKRKLAVFFVFDSEIDVRVLVIEIREEFRDMVRVFEYKKSVVNVTSVEEGFEVYGALLKPVFLMKSEKTVSEGRA